MHFTCLSCKREVFGEEYLCDECESRLIKISDGHYCKHCGKRTEIEAEYCDNCRELLTSVDIARSVFFYDGPVVPMVVRYKFYKRQFYADYFSKVMAKVMRDHGLYGDYFVFVPQAKKRDFERGFNHSKLLAEKLEQLTGIPVVDALIKAKETSHQVGLSFTKRLENLNGSFRLTKRKIFKGKTVIIVDDVMTTGATAEIIAKKLKSAGAKKVYLITIASSSYKRR